MGSELRRQLREALGPEIKGLQRAVALEIADDARYDDAWAFDAKRGRRSRVRLSDLVRWTGAKNERVVRDALRSLSLAGWEFRLPIGEGADGRPLYAIPGVAMQYRVPDFVALTVVGPSSEGTVTAGPSGLEGPAVTAQGPVVTAEGPATTAQGPAVAVPPSPVLLPASRKTSPTTSMAEASSSSADGWPADEGGGGGVFPSEYQQQAEAFVAALDYRGQAPGPKWEARLLASVAAALEAGWEEQDLKTYLDPKGTAVQFAPALYVHKLSPDQLPDADSYRAAARRPLEGTDAAVDGWMALSRRFGSHEPYRDDTWARLDEAAKSGARPAGWESVPWCGDPGCDEITRTHEETDENGLPSLRLCAGCHPALRF